MIRDRFDYETYWWLLDRLSRTHRAVRFIDLREGFPAEPFFILRHDVDYSTAAALRLARLEAERGVYATYFLLPNSFYYNLLSPEHADVPSRLAALGHEVDLLPGLSPASTGSSCSSSRRCSWPGRAERRFTRNAIFANTAKPKGRTVSLKHRGVKLDSRRSHLRALVGDRVEFGVSITLCPGVHRHAGAGVAASGRALPHHRRGPAHGSDA